LGNRVNDVGKWSPLSSPVFRRAAPIATAMAIDRPGAIEPHPRLQPKGGSAAEDGRPETFLSSARNAVGRGPRVLRGVARQGKKVARPLLRSDDRGAADPRPDSPIRGSRGALRPSTRRLASTGRAMQEDKRSERGKTCTGASMAVRRSRQDFARSPSASRGGQGGELASADLDRS
jgi:hypothetical protein